MKSLSEMKRVATMNPTYMAHKFHELQVENERLREALKRLKALAEEQKKHREGHPVDVYFGQYEELLAAIQKVIE